LIKRELTTALFFVIIKQTKERGISIMNRYNNYHKHSHYSNIFGGVDSCVKPNHYIDRILELGEVNYFTTEHGFGGDIFEGRTLCDNNNLHCKFGVEAYIVPNRSEKDDSNYHIMLIPKTNIAREKLNLCTSDGNMYGYYRKPRIEVSDLLNNFDNDIYITTACVAGCLRDDRGIKEIFLPLYEKFGKDMFLEVQCHIDDTQIAINNRCLEYSKDYGLSIIAANDSHYIYPWQKEERQNFLKGKSINYGTEDTYLLDYPSYEEMCKRFEKQGVLTNKQIVDAVEQTLIFDEVEDVNIDKEIKMPTIHPDLSEDEKIELLRDHVTEGYRKMLKEENIPLKEREKYKKQIQTEMQVIIDTKSIHTADYFLLDEAIVDKAVNEYGGTLTRGGRGSAGAFTLNKMLGLTQIDRFEVDLPIYSERFMSTARLLENRSLPDIDLNVDTQEPFVKATRDYLGYDGCYPMLAYGTMGISEAFRNVCRCNNIPYAEVNDVAKNIENYREDPNWKHLIKEAENYVGVIVNASIHPCSYLLMNDNIRQKLGVIKLGDAYCVPITSGEADEWKYLKNDYLIVTVWDIIAKTFKMINRPILTVHELLEIVKNDDRIWNTIAEGRTATLNQLDGDWSTSLVMQYKPKTVEELSCFVGAIRPNFEAYRTGFINREEFSLGVKELDELFANTAHNIIFQENLMGFFEWLGVTPSESIGLIKKISKKKIKPKDFSNLESRLKENWEKRIGNTDNFDSTWKNIQSYMSYGFNSPHGLSTALDCLYGAYLKVNYPLEYYTVVLEIYSDNVPKTNRLIEEMKYYGIELSMPKFRYADNHYRFDKANSTIYRSLSSIKNIGNNVGSALYTLKDKHYNNFCEVLDDINKLKDNNNKKIVNSKALNILLYINFFEEFGSINKLLCILDLYNMYGKAKVLSKEKLIANNALDIALKFASKVCESQLKGIDNKGLINALYEDNKKDIKPISTVDLIRYEATYLGCTNKVVECDKHYYTVLKVDTDKYNRTFLSLRRLCDGSQGDFKVDYQWWEEYQCEQGDIIKVAFRKKDKRKFVDNKWIKLGQEYVVRYFAKVNEIN
jgi:DNA polymerase III alpha subunit